MDKRQINNRQLEAVNSLPEEAYLPVNHRWITSQFEAVLEQLVMLNQRLDEITESLVQEGEGTEQAVREYYSVPEFAGMVGKSEYTVREWCRLYRIHAEKCDSGHGDSKLWKIPATELARYRDHGLLPVPTRY